MTTRRMAGAVAAEEANTAGLLNGTAFAHDPLRHGFTQRPAQRSAVTCIAKPQIIRGTPREGNPSCGCGHCAEAIPLGWTLSAGAASGLYRESLAILMPEEAIPRVRALETMSRRATALHGLNEPEQAIQLARTVLTGTTDPLLRASAHNTIAGAQLNLGNLTEVEYHARLGAEMLEDDSGLAVELKNMQVNALFHQGRLEEAEAVLVPLLEKVRDGPAQLPSPLTSSGFSA